ncbi:MAG: rod shape-determining protein MreC [Oscillospiraceae bacterium]|nr:rod shape-determining protein MreC [Oscillospiraceae bacterium]
MKALFTRKTIVIAAVAVLIAIVSIISVNIFSSNGPVSGLANVVSKPFKALATSVARTFESIYSSIYKYDKLQEDYEETLRDLAELRRASRESENLLVEVNRLRALVGFHARHEDHILEEADIVKWSSNNFVSSFTIGKGYLNSETPIERGNSVITEYGVLIGQVTDVGATTSTVISVIDTTFSAGAFVGADGGYATAKGDFALMSSGLLIIDYLSEDLVVLPGDSVVTSGTGGVFPDGLVIGEVVEVLRHTTGVGRYATVKPMRAIDSSIPIVYVITGFETSG